MKHKSLAATMVLLGVAIALSVWGDPTTLTISGASVKVTSTSSTTLNFPIARGGDTSYDAFVQYQTQDGSAKAGTDYTAANGSLLIPAGTTTAAIPVTVAGSSSSQSDKTFQMLLLGGGGAPSFTASFAAEQAFGTGIGPTSVTTADVNGDGLPDLIVANANDGTVSVLLNMTAPGATMPIFAAQQTFPAGGSPSSVTVADVNGDGLPDLIVANANDGTVSVLLNMTAPGATTLSFATQQTFAVGKGPTSVTTADVNGDGLPDLIVANGTDGTVSVLLNMTAPGATTPIFATQQTFAVGKGPSSVTTADVNGDGLSDLIVANANDGTVSVLLNSTAPGAGTPSFATQQTFAVGNGPSSVTKADVNGDGLPDLIVANANDGTVSVLLNTTAPGATTLSFATQQTFAVGNGPSSVTAADVNGDGKPDLIVTNKNSSTVSVLLNTTAPDATTPSFATQQTFATGTSPSSVTAADVNGDGKPDLLVVNQKDNTVSVLLNTAPTPATTFDSNSFATQQTFGVGSSPSSVTAADVNGDGLPDLIVANSGGITVSVLLNTTAPGASTPSFASQQTFGVGSSPSSVTAADVNGDGLPDLIVTNSGSTSVSVLLNTTAPGATTPSFAAQQTFATGSFPSSVTAADVNGDGLPDLIVANGLGSAVSVLLNTTAPGAATPSFAAQQTFAVGVESTSVTTADVNGDGLPDLIIANFKSGTVSVLLNTTAPGATTLSFTAQQTFAVGNGPSSVTAADVNGDGKPDLIVADKSSNMVSVLLNTTAPGATAPSFATRQSFAVGFAPTSVTTADVNGDGLPDLIVTNSEPGSNTVSVLLNMTAPGATTASFAAQQTFATGSSPYAVTAADVNGDGKPDLIVANSGANSVSVLLNNLYATTPSGSPATGTIHYSVPTPTATPTTTATPTATPTSVPVKLSISPTSLNFGTVKVGSHSGPKNVTVTNPKGSKKMPGFTVLMGGPSGEGNQYSVTGCNAPLSAGGKCTIGVTFTPTTAGTHNGALMIMDNAEFDPQSVKLAGKGK
ncbi:MAG TPA: FG-GAP-like repeat-containing protein [Candidatus Binataceae bacterium]|nr:FG-GAP-like repeat-containing protein [Candidatus Binataceae bacterium]